MLERFAKQVQKERIPGQDADLLAKLRKWEIYLLGRQHYDQTTNLCQHD